MRHAFPVSTGLPPARAAANGTAALRRASGIGRDSRRSGNAIAVLRSAGATAVAPGASP